ncbi:hypothetical protein PGH07_06305 [Sulfurovum sp. zt1-1]|uniref:Uncharacterized protein n=1 Tax=Sulfurovum zhangzhouensis TaxID=3019067 RepID=A0ABT7QY67_9BACT|nr:hypothetical protein [Sulfurovum zhangzhouensis]MDM5271782.1 hypothetical protein [Sulfurovum zhangzhouensis]
MTRLFLCIPLLLLSPSLFAQTCEDKVHKLHWVENAEPRKDALIALTSGNIKLIAVYGYTLLMPGVEESKIANARKTGNFTVIEGTGDALCSDEYARLNRIAYKYAKIYNETLAKNTTVLETVILGDWCAGSENAFHEEFSLTIEDGEHIFSSWLHHRPAVSGKWVLKGKTFTIYKSSGLIHIYIIEKATPKKLILKEKDYEPETYVREECISVPLPKE